MRKPSLLFLPQKTVASFAEGFYFTLGLISKTIRCQLKDDVREVIKLLLKTGDSHRFFLTSNDFGEDLSAFSLCGSVVRLPSRAVEFPSIQPE
jgi:hypothetical protein